MRIIATERPPCAKGAVCVADWGIDNPSVLPSAIHLPLHKGGFYPVGKSCSDEKSAFESGADSRQHRHKKPATSIVAAIADMEGSGN